MAELIVHQQDVLGKTRHFSKHATGVQDFQDRSISLDTLRVTIPVPNVSERRLRKKARGNRKHAEPRASLSSPEDLLIIDAEPLCPRESNDTDDRSFVSPSLVNPSLTQLMRHIYDRCYNKYARVRFSFAPPQLIDTLSSTIDKNQVHQPASSHTCFDRKRASRC